MFPWPTTGSYLQLHGQLGMQRRSCRGERLLHLIRDPRVWMQSVGKGGSPTAGVEGVEGSRCESDLWEQDGQPERVHPTSVFAGRQGFRTKATEEAEELCLVTLLTTYPFPMACARKIQNDSTDRQLRPFPWPSCWCCGR